MLHIVYGEDEAVAKWVVSKIPHITFEQFLGDPDPLTGNRPARYKAFGVHDGTRCLAGIIYHNWRQHDIEVTFAAEGPWASRRTVKLLLGYPFWDCGVVRITAVTGKSNKKSRRLLRKLGFREEGVHPLALDGKEAAVSYGLTRDLAEKWISHGQTQPTPETSPDHQASPLGFGDDGPAHSANGSAHPIILEKPGAPSVVGHYSS